MDDLFHAASYVAHSWNIEFLGQGLVVSIMLMVFRSNPGDTAPVNIKSMGSDELSTHQNHFIIATAKVRTYEDALEEIYRRAKTRVTSKSSTTFRCHVCRWDEVIWECNSTQRNGWVDVCFLITLAYNVARRLCCTSFDKLATRCQE